MRTCQVCGQPLVGKQLKFCSHGCRDAAMRKTELCTCVVCGKAFYLAPWEIRQGKGRYCTRACYYETLKGKERPSLRRRSIQTCAVCGKEFEVGGQAKHRGQVMCSWDCARRARYRSGTQSQTLTDTDAAYLAGFIDGEGSVMLYHRRDVAALRITASNTSRGVLDWIAMVTGVGQVVSHKRSSEIHKTPHWWQANAEAAESVLRQIRPHLKIKQEQADLALSVQERLRVPALKADRTWQQEAIAQMKALNKRGPRGA